jgi:hypothetical protein
LGFLYHYLAGQFSFKAVCAADAHAHVQRLFSAVKMATALREYITEENCSVVRYLWAKGLDVKDIHKEMFCVYEWKYLSRKEVHSLVANVLLTT